MNALTVLASLATRCLLGVFAVSASAADKEFNYDESKVPSYTLPNPPKMQDGRAVDSAEMWRRERRPELLELFRSHVYGQRPPKPDGITYEVEESTPEYLHGKGTRKDVRVLAPSTNGPVQLLAFTLFTPGAK